MYLNDADDTFPGVLPPGTPVNGGMNGWVPFDVHLAPYVKSDGVYRCPSDATALPNYSIDTYFDGSFYSKREYRSYGIVGNINTVQNFQAGGATTYDENTGLGTDSFTGLSKGRNASQMDEPANTIGLLENWINFSGQADSVMGEPYGSAFLNCDVRELPGRNDPPQGPSDQLPPGCADETPTKAGHTGGLIYDYLDSHAKLMKYGQVRANDFYAFKASKPSQTYVP
jgi:hypothetical protein